MKRILLMVLKNLFFVPYGWFKLCWYAAHVDNYTEEERYAVLKYIDRRAIWGGNLEIEAHGVENNSSGMPGSLFGCSKKRSCRRTFSEAGVCLYEGIYY